MKKYTLISDPGHGWLKVSTLEIIRLGIADRISTCSYIDWSGKNVYLEEDCDLAIFAVAKGWTRETIADHIRQVHQEKCAIRQMNSFNGGHYASRVTVLTVS